MEINTIIQGGVEGDSTEVISEERRAQLIEMGKSGLFYGRKKSKTHPKMKPYIYGQRSGIEIIDGNATVTMLEKAAAFLGSVVSKKGAFVLVVGTHPAAKAVAEAFARAHNFPFVNGRWIGGTLTNFKAIRGRVEHFKRLKSERDGGRLDKYTKKERLEIDREIARMDTMFGGIQNLDAVPAAIIVVDPALHEIAVREAQRANVPIIALMNTDSNIDDAAYAIPVNTNSRASIEWVLNYLANEIKISTTPKE